MCSVNHGRCAIVGRVGPAEYLSTASGAGRVDTYKHTQSGWLDGCRQTQGGEEHDADRGYDAALRKRGAPCAYGATMMSQQLGSRGASTAPRLGFCLAPALLSNLKVHASPPLSLRSAALLMLVLDSTMYFEVDRLTCMALTACTTPHNHIRWEQMACWTCPRKLCCSEEWTLPRAASQPSRSWHLHPQVCLPCARLPMPLVTPLHKNELLVTVGNSTALADVAAQNRAGSF
jgi:hypothetical protein